MRQHKKHPSTKKELVLNRQKQCAALYKTGLSLKKVGSVVDMSWAGVRASLIREGVQLRARTGGPGRKKGILFPDGYKKRNLTLNETVSGNSDLRSLNDIYGRRGCPSLNDIYKPSGSPSLNEIYERHAKNMTVDPDYEREEFAKDLVERLNKMRKPSIWERIIAFFRLN